MKKKNFKALKLNKDSISKLQLSHAKGGISLGCGDNTTTLRTNWLGCGATDNCHGTEVIFVPQVPQFVIICVLLMFKFI